MSRVTLFLLLRLMLPCMIFAGAVVLPSTIVYADSDGEDGEDGDDGEDGEDGEDGDDGEDSEDGDDGDDGDDGEDGEDGEDEDKDDSDDDSGKSGSNNKSTTGNSGGFLSRFFGKSSKSSHQQSIRRAVQDKHILPLSKIKQIVKKKTRSEILGIELERFKRNWVYEFKVVDQKGRLREIYVDAATGRILRTENKYKEDR